MEGIKTNLDKSHLLALENYKNKIDKSKKVLTKFGKKYILKLRRLVIWIFKRNKY